MADKTRVNIYLSVQMLRVLKHLAAKRGVSYSELIRLACRDYIARHADQIRAEAALLEQAERVSRA